MNYRDNEKFIKDLISTSLLDESIDWIKKNLDITDIYEEKELEDFIKGYVKSNLEVSDLFSEEEIRDAARDIGIIDIHEYREQQIDKIIE